MKKREVEVDKNFSKHHKLSPTKNAALITFFASHDFFNMEKAITQTRHIVNVTTENTLIETLIAPRAHLAQLPSHDFYDFIFICRFFNESRNLSSVGSVFNFSSFVMSPIKYYFGIHSALVGMVSRYLLPLTIPRLRERSRTHQSCWRRNLKRPQ